MKQNSRTLSAIILTESIKNKLPLNQVYLFVQQRVIADMHLLDHACRRSLPRYADYQKKLIEDSGFPLGFYPLTTQSALFDQCQAVGSAFPSFTISKSLGLHPTPAIVRV